MHLRIRSLHESKSFFSSIFSSKGKEKVGDQTVTAAAIASSGAIFHIIPGTTPPGPPIAPFNGRDKQGCDEFIRRILFRAIANGKADDPEWMAELAAGALSGAALDWYDLLDSETKCNWNLLRPAMLRRFPRLKHSKSTLFTPASAPPRSLAGPSSAVSLAISMSSQGERKTFPPPAEATWYDPSIPTPAPASALHIPSLRRSISSLHGPVPAASPSTAPSSPARSPVYGIVSALGLNLADGYLRIIPDRPLGAAPNGPPTYLASTPSRFGWYVTVPHDPTTQEQSLVVQCTPTWTLPNTTGDGSLIQLKNQSAGGRSWLDMQWSANDNALHLPSPYSAYLVDSLEQDTTSGTSAQSTLCGPRRAAHWKIDLDGTLQAIWIANDGTSHPLTVAIYDGGSISANAIHLVRDFKTFTDAHPGHKFYRASIRFEAVGLCIDEGRNGGLFGP